ncbi:MAG: chemotaxis protein CheW [Clostridiales bacterium]|jgi:chemotaxis signal transduction protein|nr:chemotaxis protein CheW [Clostridiales bacterium]
MPDCQVLLFKIRGDDYGLDISKVSSVLRNDARVTRVPGTAPHVLGVINLRGEILPIVDMRLRLAADARRAGGQGAGEWQAAPWQGGGASDPGNGRGPDCAGGANGAGGAGSASGPGGDGRIVVVRSDGVSVGLVVDSVSEVARVAASDIESPSAIGGSLPAEDVGGIVRAGGRAATLLNADSFARA